MVRLRGSRDWTGMERKVGRLIYVDCKERAFIQSQNNYTRCIHTHTHTHTNTRVHNAWLVSLLKQNTSFSLKFSRFMYAVSGSGVPRASYSVGTWLIPLRQSGPCAELTAPPASSKIRNRWSCTWFTSTCFHRACSIFSVSRNPCACFSL